MQFVIVPGSYGSDGQHWQSISLRRDRRRDRFSYSGELGTDLCDSARPWANLVARSWLDVVRDSMATIKTESERRAER
jgi:predicted alpha/beta hydrolase family esterase